MSKKTVDKIMQQAVFLADSGLDDGEWKKLREMIEKALAEKESGMNIENLQLSEEPGASPDVHLASRFKVPEGQALIKQEPDDELLQRMVALINNGIIDGKIGPFGALVVYKLIANYAPTHNQD